MNTRVSKISGLGPLLSLPERTSKATFFTVPFATLMLTTAPATTRESWPQRIEADWLLAEEVAAQDQLDGLVTTKTDAAGGCDGIAPLVLRT